VNSHSIKFVDPNSASASQKAMSNMNTLDLALSLTCLLKSFSVTSVEDLGF